MNGLPGLRLLPDAPVPDGRTVLPTQTPAASRRPLGHGRHPPPFIPVTNPLERFNREIGRRTDVVGIFPDDQSLVRLASMLAIEQNDEWLVGRRYLSAASMGSLLEERPPRPTEEEILELQAA
jgi:transposase-like protein